MPVVEEWTYAGTIYRPARTIGPEDLGFGGNDLLPPHPDCLGHLCGKCSTLFHATVIPYFYAAPCPLCMGDWRDPLARGWSQHGCWWCNPRSWQFYCFGRYPAATEWLRARLAGMPPGDLRCKCNACG